MKWIKWWWNTETKSAIGLGVLPAKKWVLFWIIYFINIGLVFHENSILSFLMVLRTAIGLKNGFKNPVSNKNYDPSCSSIVFPNFLEASSIKSKEGGKIPARSVRVPATFSSTLEYCEIWKKAIDEEINLQLLRIAYDLVGVLPSLSKEGEASSIRCQHGQALIRTVKKEGKNKGEGSILVGHSFFLSEIFGMKSQVKWCCIKVWLSLLCFCCGTSRNCLCTCSFAG